jgi:hypothetical protein
MVAAIGYRMSARKLRLFACACCRGIGDLLDDRTRAALATFERSADGLAGPAELTAARDAAFSAADAGAMDDLHDGRAGAHPAYCVAELADRWSIGSAALCASRVAAAVGCVGVGDDWPQGQQERQCALLRCAFGNPFRPVTFDSAWLAGPVSGLAEAAYTERILPSGELDPARLAVLADALEDNSAGADVLAHLRGPGPHVRGCWVIDLCTGRG